MIPPTSEPQPSPWAVKISKFLDDLRGGIFALIVLIAAAGELALTHEGIWGLVLALAMPALLGFSLIAVLRRGARGTTDDPGRPHS